jgi:hypothetical protein
MDSPMRRAPLKSLLAIACLLGLPAAQAAEGEALLEMKNTIVNMLDALVEQGILTKEKAEQIKQEAAMKAARDAAAQTAEAKAAAEAEAEATADADTASDKAGQVVRVPYVPEFVKEEIREQVRAELRKDVRDDVIQVAKEERWGVKDALPDWVNTLQIFGDARVRAEQETYSDDNPKFFEAVAENDLTTALTQFVFDPQPLNEKGFLDQLNIANNLDVARNTSEKRERLPARVRLSLVASLEDNVEVGARITTGNIQSPVSVNQDLGNDGNRFDANFDQLYLKWNWMPLARGPVITTQGGRFERPWLPQPTELVWDNDVQFEGAALTLTQGFGRRPDPFKPENAVFFSAGAYTLGEVSFSTEDRWMLGVQGGARWTFNDRMKARFGIGYYDYKNNTGRINPVRVAPQFQDGVCSAGETCFLESPVYDYTIPGFMQGGNTLMNIRTKSDPTTTSTLPVGLALASDYNVLNLTGQFDMNLFDPYHVVVDFDIAKNLGYDAEDILERVALDPRVAALNPGGNGTALFNNILTGCNGGDCLRERTLGYAVQLTFGYPVITRRWQWQVLGQYRYLERDAVLDASTESNFRQGGTDSKGYILAGLLGLSKDVIARLRYITADQIDDVTVIDPNTNQPVADGAPYGVDRLQLDVQAQF